MNAIHVMLHGRPAGATAGPVATIGGVRLPTLRVPAHWGAAGLPLTFDEVVARLAALPRMFVEPDGSFVWVADGPPPWQLDGMFWDRGAELSHVELKGTCTRADLGRLLAVLQLDPRELMFQSVAEGLFFEGQDLFVLVSGGGFESVAESGP